CTPFLASSHLSLYPLTYPELYSALCLLPGLLSNLAINTHIIYAFTYVIISTLSRAIVYHM
ncbi:MAG TPA: hypothetical protein VIQ04_05115, partial [Nitrososphaeraceae archaeon]